MGKCKAVSTTFPRNKKKQTKDSQSLIKRNIIEVFAREKHLKIVEVPSFLAKTTTSDIKLCVKLGELNIIRVKTSD